MPGPGGLWWFFWGVLWGFFLMGVLLCREKSCEGGFLGLCGDVRGVGVLGRVGLGVFVQGGVVFWLVWSRCACAGLAPRSPLLLVGGRRRARGGMVRAEDAGLCALEIRGLSPRTPFEAVQGCPPVGGDARQRMGFLVFSSISSTGARREQAPAPRTLLTFSSFCLCLRAT